MCRMSESRKDEKLNKIRKKQQRQKRKKEKGKRNIQITKGQRRDEAAAVAQKKMKKRQGTE